MPGAVASADEPGSGVTGNQKCDRADDAASVVVSTSVAEDAASVVVIVAVVLRNVIVQY